MLGALQFGCYKILNNFLWAPEKILELANCSYLILDNELLYIVLVMDVELLSNLHALRFVQLLVRNILELGGL